MSAEMPKMPEPVYIFWSADTLHIRLWTADPERAARFAADTGATATVYVPKQQVQEAARQAMERLQLPRSYGGSTFASWGDQQEGCTVRIHFTNTSEAQAWFSRLTDRWDAIRALIPQDPDHLAGVGNMVDGKDQSEKRHG